MFYKKLRERDFVKAPGKGAFLSMISRDDSSRNLHGNFHEFHITNFVFSNLVCLYSFSSLIKHLRKITAIEIN